MMKLLRKSERGFSLVELMIVVAIIAILAAIAIPAFMRFALKSKTSEASGNLSAIRTAEEAYRAEHDVYADTGESPPNPGVPPSSPQQWDDITAAGGTQTNFADIGFEPDGDVRYQYIVTVTPAAGTAQPFFVAVATGDLDDDTQECTFTITKGALGYPKPVKNLGGGGGEF